MRGITGAVKDKGLVILPNSAPLWPKNEVSRGTIAGNYRVNISN